MILFLLLIVVSTTALKQVDKGCNHPIFCNDSILQAAADSGLFEDSKTFVDLTLKAPINQVLQNFKTQSPKQFIESNFDMNPDLLLENVTFIDYKDDPQILSRISDPQMKRFGSQLNKRWNLLGKKVNFSKATTVGTCEQNCSSYLPMVNNMTMLVPGGRFRQNYYWDTYWIILGLVASDMLTTAEMILNNFAKVIEIYGFIPNGFRAYFLNRSQPPFFFMMVKSVVEALRKKGLTDRADLLQKKMFHFLNIEHQYWESTHLLTTYIKGTTFNVNQYRADTTLPRPESYKEDMATASKIINPQERSKLFMRISSMAESGWDFSSRWLKGQQLSTTVMDKLIQSDLNNLLGMMEKYMANLCIKYNLRSLYENYVDRYQERINYFNAIKNNDRYPDFNLESFSFRPDIPYPSDFTPYMFLEEKHSLKDVYNKLINAEASSLETGQQWDAPNVWAPNSWIIHQVAPSDEAKQYAIQWVQTTYCGWIKHGNLFEKYNSNIIGQRGEGGEYKPQVGFGWTNGLALHYLSLYPDITIPSSCS